MTLVGVCVCVSVPDPVGRELQDLRVSLGEPEAAGIPTHVTLVPPTEVAPTEAIDRVCDHLAGAAGRHSPFTVRLRGTGSFWPLSPVVFVALTAGTEECERLAADVRRGPLATELQFPYHPHVTVAHQDDETVLRRAGADLADFAADFTVASFWLYTWAGSSWTPRHEFVLEGSGRPAAV